MRIAKSVAVSGIVQIHHPGMASKYHIGHGTCYEGLDPMSNRLFLQGRVRLILCLLVLSLFLITSGAASRTQPGPSIMTKPLAGAFYMQPYSTTLQSSFGTPPYTYALTAGGLPPGITLDQSGNITGTPTSTGSWSFQVRVTDSSPTHVQRIAQYSLPASIGQDIYGGLTAMPSPNGASGYFRVEKN